MELVATEQVEFRELTGYQQTEVGTIPVDWKVKKVGDAFDICNNLRLPISESVRKTFQGIYPYYGPTKIQDYINEYRVEGEYALIGEDGDHFLKWNEIPMTQIACGKFNVNNHAHLVKGKNNITLTEWFYFFFKHRDITPHLSRQGAGRYKLNKRTLLNIPFALPPTITEQKAIATALSDVDALISSLEKLIAKKKAIKQGAMQQLLKSPNQGGKRLAGFEGDWEEKEIGTFCHCYSGGTPNTSKAEYYGGNIPWITSSELNKVRINAVEDTITVEGLKNSSARIVKKGTLLLAMYGATAGVAAITDIEGAINQAILAIEPFICSSEFLFQYLLLNKDSIIKTYTQGGQPNLSGQIIKKIVVSMPSTLEEQRAIAKILSEMDAEIEALEKKKSKYHSIKQGMMQELLTGKTRLV